MYYLQVYRFYDELVPEEAGPVVLTRPDGTIEPSPSRTSARSTATPPHPLPVCFTAEDPPDMLAGRFDGSRAPRPSPLRAGSTASTPASSALPSKPARPAPSCPSGTSSYGIDRVVAVLPDGRGFAWHQINACGEVVFDGNPPPPGCPPVPERPN
jgi:hypothetical protein